MRTRLQHISDASRARGFTLIEVLLALAICAIVMVAINAVFATALHLRDRTSAVLEASLPVNRAFEVLRNDLKGTVGPGGFLAGDFKCGAQSMGTSMGMSGEAGGGGLDFFTSTGQINEAAPWSDVQEVFYELQAPSDHSEAGMQLVRCVNRNLLATTTQTADVQWLISGVQTIHFECYDGVQWRDTWDTSLTDTNLPAAVRVSIQLVAKEGEDARSLQPLQMIVPLLAQTTRTNSTSTSTSTSGGTQ